MAPSITIPAQKEAPRNSFTTQELERDFRNIWGFLGGEWRLLVPSCPIEKAHDLAPKFSVLLSMVQGEAVSVLPLSAVCPPPYACL